MSKEAVGLDNSEQFTQEFHCTIWDTLLKTSVSFFAEYEVLCRHSSELVHQCQGCSYSTPGSQVQPNHEIEG